MSSVPRRPESGTSPSVESDATYVYVLKASCGDAKWQADLNMMTGDQRCTPFDISAQSIGLSRIGYQLEGGKDGARTVELLQSYGVSCSSSPRTVLATGLPILNRVLNMRSSLTMQLDAPPGGHLLTMSSSYRCLRKSFDKKMTLLAYKRLVAFLMTQVVVVFPSYWDQVVTTMLESESSEGLTEQQARFLLAEAAEQARRQNRAQFETWIREHLYQDGVKWVVAEVDFGARQKAEQGRAQKVKRTAGGVPMFSSKF